MITDHFAILDWVLLSLLLVCMIVQVYFYLRYMAAPLRAKSEELRAKSEETPGVSVVLCAHNERENLSHYLRSLLNQDYPEFEVIVVDDGSEDDTRAIVESYMALDPRLHLTFVPYGARVRSTKKLALTLAAKSAQYDFLLLTDADCVPESDQWIRRMMEGFSNSPKDGLTSNSVSGLTSIVLGFSPYFETQGLVNRIVRYDTLFNGLHYLGAALCGHPYMGVGRNLAYRKALFFESGGFTHLMTNKAGDDDLFVNHVATPQNTAVVLSRDSFVWSPPKKTFKEWWQQKRRHLSVSPAYRRETKCRLAIEPLTRGLFYAVFLAEVVYQLPITNYQLPIPLLIAVSLFLIRWLMQTAVINLSAKRMGLRRFSMLTILGLDIFLPLTNLWMLLIPKKEGKW